MEQTIVIIQMILFVVLFTTFIYVSVKKTKISNFQKWVIAISALIILGLSDKLKLIAGAVVFAVYWLINHFTTKKHQNGIKRSWKLDS